MQNAKLIVSPPPFQLFDFLVLKKVIENSFQSLYILQNTSERKLQDSKLEDPRIKILTIEFSKMSIKWLENKKFPYQDA